MLPMACMCTNVQGRNCGMQGNPNRPFILPWACGTLCDSFYSDNFKGRKRNVCFPSQGSKGVCSSNGKVSLQGCICLSTNYTLETAQKEASCDYFHIDAGRQCTGKLEKSCLFFLQVRHIAMLSCGHCSPLLSLSGLQEGPRAKQPDPTATTL